jgi:hypothetical protein
MWQQIGRPVSEMAVQKPELDGEHRELQRLASLRRCTPHFVDRGVYVVNGDLVIDDQALWIKGRKVRQGVVERPGGLLPTVLDHVEIAECADLAVGD